MLVMNIEIESGKFLRSVLFIVFTINFASLAQGQAPDPRANPSPQTQPDHANVLSLPLVAKPMSAADVETLFNRVGLLPFPEDQRVVLGTQFNKSLAEVIVIADLSRAALNEGEYKKIVDSLAASNAADEPTSIAQRNMIKSLRAKAIEIDLTLINSAAQGLAKKLDPTAQKMLDTAQLLRRTDAAAETMRSVNGMQLPFVTISSGLPSSTKLVGKELDDARAILFSDADARAGFAERISLGVLEVESFDRAKAIHDMQVGLTNALAAEITIDPVALQNMMTAFQMRGVFTPANELAKLDMALVQSIESKLPLNIAFEMISSLENPQRDIAASGSRAMYITQLTSKILALPKLSVQQSQSVRAAFEKWQRMDIQSFVSQLQIDAVLFESSASVSKSIVIGDSQTWQINPVSPAMQRFQQQSEKRVQVIKARRTAAKNMPKEFEAILGPELWAAFAPVAPPIAKPSSK